MTHASFLLPYLMLVSFLTPPLSNPAVSKVTSLNDSPFQGVAVMLRCAYSTQEIHERDFASSVRLLKLRCKKDIWPWVFVNRLIGVKAGDESTPFVDGTELAVPFKLIKGMDIYNRAGALEDFYRTWKIALKTAQKMGSPGIVLDTEAYNNYLSAELPYLAGLTSSSAEQARQRLEEIGKELTDLADKWYPDATIWILAGELGHRPTPPRTVATITSLRSYYVSPAYIITGMLDRAKEKQSRLTFISGGQESLGYCHHTRDTMVEKIQRRQEKFKPFLQSYKNLRLAGTIALWDRVESKGGFFATNRECRDSTVKTLADFEPLLKLLFTHYRYNWIYASDPWDNPYDRRISAQYTELLKRAQNETYSHASNQ